MANIPMAAKASKGRKIGQEKRLKSMFRKFRRRRERLRVTLEMIAGDICFFATPKDASQDFTDEH